MDEIDSVRTKNNDDQRAMMANGKKHVAFNIDSYENQKNVAAGTMNLALLASNGNQLALLMKRLEKDASNAFDNTTICLIVVSMVVEIIIGILVLMVGTSKVHLESMDKDDDVGKRNLHHKCKWISVLGMMATVTNVLATSFSGR